MNEVLRVARLKIALQGAFLGRAILIFTVLIVRIWDKIVKSCKTFSAYVLFIWARLESKYFSGKVFPLSLIGTSNF